MWSLLEKFPSLCNSSLRSSVWTHLNTVSVGMCVHHGCFSAFLDSCMITAAAVTTFANIPLWWMFCFWIMVNIFILHWRVEGVMIYNEELLTTFVLLVSPHIVAGSGRGRAGRGRCAPFLKFTGICVQTTLRGFPWRGRATFKVWVISLPSQGKTGFVDMAG